MKRADVVIIGGSAAGPQAAMVATRHYMIDSILVIRREEKVLVPCGIPYIFGTLGSPDKNLMPDTVLGDAELMVDEATGIDRSSQTVSTAGGETIGYKKLVLAIGSRPVVPPIPGAELENVFTVKKDVDYLQQLQQVLAGAQDLVVIGGGFIGVEFADECRKLGLNVTIVELLPHCLQLVCTEDLCARAEEKLREAGIRVITGNAVKSILGDGKVEGVELSDGERLKADVVIIGIGVTPNTELAREAGLEIGELRGIKVDEYMMTTDPNIFAAGDCAEKFSFFTGKPIGLRLASIATAEARIAVTNLFEQRRKNRGAMGVFSTKIGDLAVAVAGLHERAAAEAGFDIITGESAAVDKHPGSMPGAAQLSVRLVFERQSGRLLGGEIWGGSTAAEIANTLAALISQGVTAEDVTFLQVGTHPAFTASPLASQIVNAAERAIARVA
ncbi:MAG: FAD-dependent oxidoreductase [Chloroflexi bacterium]|jgi:NADPH-dependent 2,4-dienoyl-CoA reductase/sulfur reductase-like enzyme|nr:FAD-dependent oxidoreductase [Chloroflexota bacterium]